TATMFCCGRSVATLIAGYQIMNSRSAARAVCRNHTTTPCTPRVRPPTPRQTRKASTADTPMIEAQSPHTGQPEANRKVPRLKMPEEYLNRNSNMVQQAYINESKRTSCN